MYFTVITKKWKKIRELPEDYLVPGGVGSFAVTTECCLHKTTSPPVAHFSIVFSVVNNFPKLPGLQFLVFQGHNQTSLTFHTHVSRLWYSVGAGLSVSLWEGKRRKADEMIKCRRLKEGSPNVTVRFGDILILSSFVYYSHHLQCSACCKMLKPFSFCKGNKKTTAKQLRSIFLHRIKVDYISLPSNQLWDIITTSPHHLLHPL